MCIHLFRKKKRMHQILKNIKFDQKRKHKWIRVKQRA